MSFTNFTTEKSISFGGEYRELVENERLRYTDNFDDQNLAGEIQVTVLLKNVSLGTEMSIVQEGLFVINPLEASSITLLDYPKRDRMRNLYLIIKKY